MSNLLKRVDKELEIAKDLNPIMAMGMLVIRKMIIEGDQDVISFRRLNGLTPNLHSCTMKVYEEIGELMQLLGKGQGASGEQLGELNYADWLYKVLSETLDVAQSLVTLAFTLADENNIDIPGEIGRHEAKLVAKGYLADGGSE